MSSSRLFVSSFLIGLGAFLLLVHLDLLPLHWLSISRFWPAILILVGIWVLDRKRRLGKIPVVLLGLVLAMFGGALVEWTFSGEWQWRSAPEESENFSLPFGDSTRRAVFRLAAGAGTFDIDGTTTHLVDAEVHSTSGPYAFHTERFEQSEEVSLRQQGKHKMWFFSRSGNRVSTRLNPSVPWDIHVDVGASALNLNLEAFTVERITVNCGVSDIRMRLGDRSEDTRCSISAGASSIKIFIPRSSACEIDADAPLSRKSFNGFEKTGGGTYQTENFLISPHKIFITLDAGVSNLKVVRY